MGALGEKPCRILEWGSRIMGCTPVKVSKEGEQLVGSHGRKVNRVAGVE